MPDQNIGIETDHRRGRRRATISAAPSTTASVIRSSVTRVLFRGLIMPRSAEAGRFGNRTTLPSGCTKNFTRSPGFSPRYSRMGFGIVAWPLTVMADSIDRLPLHINKSNTSWVSGQADEPDWLD